MFVAALLAGCVAESTEVTEEETAAAVVIDERPTAAELEAATPVARQQLARVALYYGELVYYATADGLAVMSVESSEPTSSGELAGLARDASVLDSYLSVTSAATPVPRLLVVNEPSEAIRARAAGRVVVEAISATVIGLPKAQLTGVVTPLGSVTEWCQGTTSASFAADVCTRNNWDVDFCHNGTWFSVNDGVGWSGRKQWSRSRTLACGANGRVRHYYKFGGVWYEPIDEPIPSGSLRRWTMQGNSRLAREITHSRTASGFVRGASHFRDFPF